MQELVDNMIQEVIIKRVCIIPSQEMKTFRPRNYLEEWPMPAVKFEDDLALQVRFHFCVCKTLARMGASSNEATVERI